MDSNQPPLVRIYQSCQLLMNIKRKMFQTLKIEVLPHSPHNEQKRTTSSMVYLYLKKVTKEIRHQISELALGIENQNHIGVISKVVSNLKNDNEFLSQEQKLIIEAHKIIQNWNKTQDPQVFYEQGVRAQLRNSLNGKLTQIYTFSDACKETKKPLYVRKLERELRDNLHVISQNERRYNTIQFGLSVGVRKKVLKMLSKLTQSLSRRERNNLVEIEKNMLLSHYIDIFHGEGKLTESQIKNYRKDLLKTVRNIGVCFHEQKLCFEGLLTFIEALQGAIKSLQKQLLGEEDQIIDQISNVSPDINHIVNFEEALQIINGSKMYFITLNQLNQFRVKLPKLKTILEEAINDIGQFSKGIIKRESKSKSGEVAQFIEDKKFLESLVKRQDSFEGSIFQLLRLLLERMYKNRNTNHLKTLESEDIRKFKHQKAILNIFENYFQEIQEKEKVPEGKSAINQRYKLSHHQQEEVRQIEEFVESLKVFQQVVDWQSCYQCSLGPRLLIHGRMKLLSEGLYYHSHFNKKNYFFGKTRIFIPKEELFEINKESAFVIFPDVLEVVTKKGNIYFHALGKRQEMLNQLNQCYFPEVNMTEENTGESQFNQFLGDLEQVQARVKPYTQNLQNIIGQGDIPNLSLRTFFHKYSSEQPFHYQGKSYQCFKYYNIQLLGGSNAQGGNYSPGIPYYLQISGANPQKQQDIPYSQRFFTFKRDLPVIPFVSKGGQGICQEKNVYYWGGPKCFVQEKFSTLAGLSLTEGMLIRARIIFQEKKGGLHYQISGQVTFETESAVNNLLRGPAISQLKVCMEKGFQMIRKIQKIKKARKGVKKGVDDGQNQLQYEQRISQLQTENAKLKKILTRSLIAGILLYFLTIVILIY